MFLAKWGQAGERRNVFEQSPLSSNPRSSERFEIKIQLVDLLTAGVARETLIKTIVVAKIGEKEKTFFLSFYDSLLE